MKKLGLDLGSSSIGWAIREDNKIEKRGVITFQSGMMKGQSGGYTSPTRERREARSKRRLLQARKYRKCELLKILISEYVPLNITELEIWFKYQKGQIRRFPENKDFLKWLACDFSYENGLKYNNPYELRVRAIDHKLSKHEFGRALYHLVQRRGYKKIGETDKETKKQIERRGESGFQKALDKNRTIAEALANEFLSKGFRARNQYPYRGEYKLELEQICKGQGHDISQNDKNEYSNEFVQRLWKAIIWQRPLRSQKGNIGKCTFEPTKPRCPISHPVFEIFRTWSLINTIKYDDDNSEKQSLSQELRDQLFEFFLKKDKNFKFEEIRIFLDKHLKSKNKYNYPVDSKTSKYNSSVSGMPVCKKLIEVFGDNLKESISTIHNFNVGNAPKIINGYSIYDLWHVLFNFDSKSSQNSNFLEEFAKNKLQIANVRKNEKQYNPFEKIKDKFTTGYSALSLKAMCKIIPFLKEGYLYNEAVVLAKLPELLGKNWEHESKNIFEIFKQSNKQYYWNKTIASITNILIDKYKGLDDKETFAHNNFKYMLNNSDISDVNNACLNYFGDKSWKNRTDKNEIVKDVKEQYQSFFNNPKRTYQETPLLTKIFKENLEEKKIHLVSELYHHSQKSNLYGVKVFDKKTGIEILPEPRIDSIRNPMFNKTMSILRKLINELIFNNEIDHDTEVVIEIARELNDNNKRAAIERYQNERRNNRDKYRTFLEEFKEKEKPSMNLEESISTFELWTEQILEDTEDEKGNKVNKNTFILREKEAIKRYELWMEQKCQCIYTGKMISITQLFSNEIDIEHTIPRSILPDNTLANQTVCYANYNRDKKKKHIPKQCANYYEDKDGWGTRIEPRLNNWIEKRDNYKKLYDERLKPSRNEDEVNKNMRIQEKHYYKMHYDYWHDKVERFTADEVKEGWARRQLVDTQMVSKYAREFLKTYFRKVSVQKGSTTADFRKIYGFQKFDEGKNREGHPHHAIDASVLTLIPVNSSRRDKILKKMYEEYENGGGQYITSPFEGFDPQKLIDDIHNNILIVNYEQDKIMKQSFKNIRKRGRLQYVKNKNGEFVYTKNGMKIIKKSKGSTVRSELFAQTYLGKIRDVEKYEDGQPIRHEKDWKYKKGKDEFLFVKRESIEKVKGSDKLIESIVDPVIKKLVIQQKNKSEIKDYNNKIIRHIRIKTSTGKEVKNRTNYLSKHYYKNKFYSEAGSLPYAILVEKYNPERKFKKKENSLDTNVDRIMFPIASFEIARMKKDFGKFDLEKYVEKQFSEYSNWTKKLLKIGQKVIVLNNANEYEQKNEINFQKNRLYKISQFSEGSIWLKYHLEAQSKDEIKETISELKDRLLRNYEISLNIPEVIEDASIQDVKKKKEDFKNRKFRFDTINNSYRLKRLTKKIGLEKTIEIKNELDKYKAISGAIELEGKTPLLKMSAKNWNFLYEDYDFEVSLLGKIKWI